MSDDKYQQVLGKVESGVGHAQKTPLKGLRFETIEAAQRHLDQWEERWADTRIHGTVKRQVAAMYAEERPFLLELPVEPFRPSRLERSYWPCSPAAGASRSGEPLQMEA